MSYYMRLTKGGRYLDLAQLPYQVAESYLPFTSNEAPVTGSSQGLNSLTGAELSGIKYDNTEFSFSLNIIADSAGEIKSAYDRLNAFLKQAGDTGDPMFLEWKENDLPVPIYGQWNAPRRTEVIWGEVEPSASYNYFSSPTPFQPECRVALVLKPHPEGVEQLVGKASGAILNHWYGNSSRKLQGIGISGSGANKFSNPVFGNSTFDAGWDTDTNLWDYKVTDKELYLFGTCSVELSSRASNVDYYEDNITLTAADYIISFFARKRDGSAVTSADIQAYYNGSGQTTRYIQLGDSGWYWCVGAKFTGLATPAQVGARMGNNKQVIVDGFKCEQSSFATPFGYGDMLGWTWDGTPHASTSTRSAGKIIHNWTNVLNRSAGTICVVWVPSFSAADVTSGKFYLLQTSTTDWSLVYNAASTRMEFYFSTSLYASSDIVGLTAGTPVCIHLAYDNSVGTRILVNGANTTGGTGNSTFIINANTLYIGSDTTPANHAYGYLSAFTTYDLMFTDAQALADYTSMLPLMTDRKLIDLIIYHWHKDGVNWDVNSVTDSSNQNYSIIGGIPGDAPAKTRMEIQPSTTINSNGVGGLLLSRTLVTVDTQINTVADFYGDLSGTTDTNSSGGAYGTATSVTTTEQSFTTIAMKDIARRIFSDQQIGVLTRIEDALGTGLMMRFAYNFGVDAIYYSDWVDVESKNAFLMRLTKFLTFKDISRNIAGLEVTYPSGSGFTLQVKRSSGTGNVNCDFYQIITQPTLRIYCTSSTATIARVVYDSERHDAVGLKSTDEMSTDLIYVEGRRFELIPDYQNLIVSCEGDFRRELGEVVNDDSLYFNKIVVTPRYRMG